jgi:hypothetical protein
MISKENILSYCFISFFLILISQFSYSQEKKDTTLFKANFFEVEDPVDLTLIFNVTKLKRTKDDENYMPGTLEFFSEDSIKITKNIRVRARGFARKKQCNLPPFLINVNDTSISREFIAGAKKIKVVSDCNSSNTYREYVLKEFLAYKIFNIITDNSFRVRLVNLKLIDTGRKNRESNSLVFIIEPEELLAQRLNSMAIKINNLNFHQIEGSTTDMMSFFQYMIGNTDFAIVKRHNVKLLLSNDFQEKMPFAVPYDFDYAGLVNTFYAVPDVLFGISDVTQRYYRGMCRTDAEFQDLIDYYLEKEDDIIGSINSFDYLEEKPKNEVLEYIEQFYLELKDPDFIKKIRKSCKQ